MEMIIDNIYNYGYKTIIIAICVNLLTSIIKIPIKNLAEKLNDKTAVTRYITFLPVLLSFLLCFLYRYVFLNKLFVDEGCISLWLSSASLSLALYAVFEKFFPTKKKVLQEYELKQNYELLEKLKEINKKELVSFEKIKQIIDKSQTGSENTEKQKIILRGNLNAETDKERQ